MQLTTMKLNFEPERCAFIDFETQSAQELSTVHKYATHESTNVLTCAVKVDDTMHRFGPYMDAEAMAKLLHVTHGCVLVAHNAPFDAAIWEHTLKLPEREWFDTLPCCRAAGLPGKLDDVGTILTGQGKDKNGKRLIDMLCILRNNRVPAVGPAHQLLLDYNVRDVELLEEIYDKVRTFGEPDVIAVDRVINDRGVPLDRPMLMRLLELYETNAVRKQAEFKEATDGVLPTSPAQVKAWLKRQGFTIPLLNGRESIGKFAYKDLIAHPENFFVGDSDMDAAVEVMCEAMELRRELVRVGKSKAVAALEGIEHDDRIREQFVYWGAGPGRWAGRGLQLHNMPLTVKNIDVRDMEPTYENASAAAAQASERLGQRIAVADVLGAMLRHLVRAENFLCADYAAVEARGLAWVAHEQKMLDIYMDPKESVYIDMGTKVFGRVISKKLDAQEYTFAKSLVLGCGYGMSGAKFEYTCKSRGISVATLERAGMKPAEAVKVYRQTYAAIPAVWKLYHDAVHAAVGGYPTEAGRCQFTMVGPDLYATLPSGRPIVYRNARIELRVPGYCKLYGMPETQVPTVIYDRPNFGRTGFLYGSKVCENMVQGICRDLLADTLVKCEEVGLCPVLHVHDEVVCMAPEDKLPLLLEIMSSGPSWAEGFPILVEGYSGPVWTKQTKGYKEQAALKGMVLDV